MTILVIAEHDHGSIKGATLNTVTAALACGGAVHVLVAGHNAAGAAQAAAQIAGVTRVVESDRGPGAVGYEVESERGRDIRRELAQAVVGNGWGLLELRPMRMSLEEIFLSLTTEEAAQAPAGEDTANA